MKSLSSSTRITLAIVIALLFALSPSLAVAQEEPTFHAQSNVVLVPALVRNKAGEIVYGLQGKDFIIEDDGKPQAVQLDEAAESEPISLVVAVQIGRRADYELPRMRGLGSMLQPLMQQPGTKVAVLAFDSQIHGVQNFTGNADAVSRGLESLQPGDDNAAILDAVSNAVTLLDSVPQGRKRVLLLISETRDHGSRNATIDDVIRAIGNSNVVVYTLAFAPWKSNVLDTLKGNNNPDLHPGQTEIHEGPDLLAPLELAIEAMRKNSARAVASLSGGEYQMFDSAKGFDAHMTDFSNHLHSRYLLSFQPAQPHPGLHQLTVRLKEPGNDAVLARGSYWAKGNTP